MSPDSYLIKLNIFDIFATLFPGAIFSTATVIPIYGLEIIENSSALLIGLFVLYSYLIGQVFQISSGRVFKNISGEQMFIDVIDSDNKSGLQKSFYNNLRSNFDGNIQSEKDFSNAYKHTLLENDKNNLKRSRRVQAIFMSLRSISLVFTVLSVYYFVLFVKYGSWDIWASKLVIIFLMGLSTCLSPIFYFRSRSRIEEFLSYLLIEYNSNFD